MTRIALLLEDRRDFIGAALVTGEISLAAKQVEVLLAQQAPAPIDIVWAGRIAARQSDPVLALDYAGRVLADKRAKPNDILAAATLVLSVTNRSSQPYAEAWHQIETVARDPKNPGSLDALAVLANEQALPPITPIGGNASLSLESRPKHLQRLRRKEPPPPRLRRPRRQSSAGTVPPATLSTGSSSQPTPPTQPGDTVTLDLAANSPSTPAGRTMTLKEVADALENHPNARPSHKLLALDVRARQNPALADQYVADGVERFGNAARLAQTYQGGGDLADETLLALATFLNKIGRPAKTLEVLPEATRSNGRTSFCNTSTRSSLCNAGVKSKICS